MPDLDEQLRSYAGWLADRADVEAGERAAAPAAVVPGPRARRGSWLVGAAAAVAVLIAGLVLLARSPDDVIPAPPATEPTAPVAPSPIDEVNVGGGMIVPVVGDAVTIDEVDVHQAAASTADVSELLTSLGGDPVDLSLEPVAASEFPFPDDFTGRRPRAVAVIGSRDDVAVAVHGRREAIGDVRCALFVSLETGSWLDGCAGGPLVGAGGVLGNWVVWADLPEQTAVVVVVDADRQPVAYQQPTGRAVAFNGTPVGHLMRAYDASGRILDEQDRTLGSDTGTPAPTTFTVDDDPSPVTTGTEPASAEPIVEPTVDVAAALTGWNWEGSGIDRACGDVGLQQQQATRRRCTQVVIDPQGIPVSFDPLARRVTRERREDVEPIAFTLPDEYVDPSLLAVGPDDVVYFALDNDWPSPFDVVAMSLASGDTGRIIGRFPAVLPIGDADILPAPTGLVVSGWYDPGLRPSSEEIPVVAWVARDGGVPSPIPLGAFDDANNRVGAHGWRWNIDDRLVIPDQPGSSAVMPTFDGGFIAAYSETTGAMRTELIRGWRDGTVEHVELPMPWTELDGPLVLEPQGTLLVPNGESFARITPFENPATGWDGELQVDVAAATATPIGLDDYLDTIDWPTSGQSHVWPWGTSPIAFANAVAGGSPTSPSELRTIEQGPVDDSTVVVTVTTEGFLDDSVHGTRLIMHISLDQPGFRIVRIDWYNTCRPGRGHQDYRAAHCT